MPAVDPEWFDLLKIWGPLALGWPIAYMLGRELLSWVREQKDQVKADIESRLKMANSLDALTKVVEKLANGKS